MSDPLERVLRAPDPRANEAARRFADHAAAAGEADLAYTTVASPLGELLLVAGRSGLTQMHYLDQPLDPLLQTLARRRSPRIVESAERAGPLAARARRVLQRLTPTLRGAARLGGDGALPARGPARDSGDPLRRDLDLHRRRDGCRQRRARSARLGTRSGRTRWRSSCPATACSERRRLRWLHRRPASASTTCSSSKA